MSLKFFGGGLKVYFDACVAQPQPDIALGHSMTTVINMLLLQLTTHDLQRLTTMSGECLNSSKSVCLHNVSH